MVPMLVVHSNRLELSSCVCVCESLVHYGYELYVQYAWIGTQLILFVLSFFDGVIHGVDGNHNYHEWSHSDTLFAVH